MKLVQDVSRDARSQVAASALAAKQALSHAQELLEEVIRHGKELSGNAARARSSIESTADDLVSRVNERRAELLEQVDAEERVRGIECACSFCG